MSAKIPKNIRFRKDQVAALEEMQDAETDFSALVRKAVDELLAKRQTARAQEIPLLPYGSKIYALIITDREGRTLEINEEFTKLCGYTIEEMRGRKPGHLLQGEKSEPDKVEQMRQAIEEQQRFDDVLTNYDRDGQPYRVHIMLEPIFERGELTGFRALEEKIG